MHNLIPIHHLSPGQTAQIGRLVGRPEHVQRLEELGLRSGTMVEMVQPGSPCVIRLSGSKLCFRHCERSGVLVSPAAIA